MGLKEFKVWRAVTDGNRVRDWIQLWSGTECNTKR